MLPGFLSVSDCPMHRFDATFHKVGLQLSGPGYAADTPAGSNSNPARVKRDAKSIASIKINVKNETRNPVAPLNNYYIKYLHLIAPLKTCKKAKPKRAAILIC